MKNFKHRTALYAIPWASLFIGWLLGVSAGENSETLGAWLLLASALLFGLPHGAYDFWILSDATRGETKRWLALGKILAAYLLLALFIGGVWYFLPSIALISFLALTAWHFGSGDAIWESDVKLEWFLNSVGRGLLIVSAPLAFHPQDSAFVFSKLDANASEILIYFAPYTLAVGMLLLLLTDLTGLFQKTNFQRQFSGRLETLFLLLFFWLTTPLLAVTVYLVGVHSWRHLLRLEIYERNELNSKIDGLWGNIGRFHGRALPLTVLSLIGAALIIWLLQLRVSDLADQTSAYLILLSALTVPHAALITRTELKRQKSPDIYQI
ncbi:MAG: Brp/Blh family beta-carotene 15,15'-dioxygenase [Pyrinomonadaceae bacterium]|nr:Brp/Blh family beta-carotene 15,15'-dioxygenase [Pyrinomonadaceae bacterium]